MKNFIFLFLFIIGISPKIKAQSYELGAYIGVSMYNGDLSPGELGDYLEDFRPAVGAYGKIYFTHWLAGRLSLTVGQLYGDDDPDSKYASRNLDFRSILAEAGLTLEIHPFQWGRVSPYLIGGIAGFYFNPKTDLNGTTYELQSFGTEGQGIPGRPEKYSRLETSLIFGGGLRLELENGWAIFGEFAPRYAHTDYIDDAGGTLVNYSELVANNGALAGQLSIRDPKFDSSPSNTDGYNRGGGGNDWYIVGTIGVALNLGGGKGFGKGKKAQGCPTF